MINVWLLLVIEIILLYIAYYLNGKDFLSPSVLTIAVFILSTLCIIYNHEYWAVSYKLYTTFVVSLGLLIAVFADYVELYFVRRNPKYSNNLHYELEPVAINPFINTLSCLFLTVCLLIFLRKIMELGTRIGVTGFLSIGAVKDSAEVSVQGIPLICYDLNILGSFIYIYILCNNIISGVKIKKCLIYIYPILLGVLAGIFRGNRGVLIQIVIGIIVEFVILYRWKNGIKSINTRVFIKKSIPIFALFSIAFYFLREIVKGRSVTSTFINYFTYYLGSPLFLFNKYLQDPLSVYSSTNYFGGTTFANFYGYLYSKGIVSKPVGILNFTNVVPGTTSAGNEYCFFMRPYHDFGLVGMLIFTFIFFSIFSHFYYKLRNIQDFSKRKVFRLIVFSYFYFMVFMTFYYCFTAQEFRPQTVVLMLALYVAYFLLIKKRIVFGHRRGDKHDR